MKTLQAGDQPTSIAESLRLHVAENPERFAFTYLLGGEGEGQTVTYGELLEASSRLAAELGSRGLVGHRVLLLFPPGLQFIVAFVACLLAGTVAVPCYLPKLGRVRSPADGIASDCDAAAILSIKRVRDDFFRRSESTSSLLALPWLVTDDLAFSAAPQIASLGKQPNELCYLQYTSGSTSSPKGVMVSHGNVVANCRMIASAMRLSAKSIFVSWLPHYHDMGLVGGILEPLWLGAHSILLPSSSVVQRPARWPIAISRFRATVSGGPTFGYALCLNAFDHDDYSDVDLSCWTVACVGAEPINKAVLDRFSITFSDFGFKQNALHPCYGLAEATLMVTGGMKERLVAIAAADSDNPTATNSIGRRSPREIVGCGAVVGEGTICIVDPSTRRICHADQEGEIWLKGKQVALGYWNRPSESEGTFAAYTSEPKAGPFLRTGDLGFLRKDELYVSGRIKDLVIIRGQNHHPEDIETAMQNSASGLSLAGAAAFSVLLDGAEELVVIQECKPRDTAGATRVVDRIRSAVARECGISPYCVGLVRLGSIPRGTSGKIQRFACREAFLRHQLNFLALWRDEANAAPTEKLSAPGIVAPWHDVGALLDLSPSARRDLALSLLVTSAVKATGRSAESIDPGRALTSLGIDSVSAVRIAHFIQEQTGFLPPFDMLFTELSLRELGASLFSEILAAQIVPEGMDEKAALKSIELLSDSQVSRLLADLQRAPHTGQYPNG